jgi:hypothetical protein
MRKGKLHKIYLLVAGLIMYGLLLTACGEQNAPTATGQNPLPSPVAYTPKAPPQLATNVTPNAADPLIAERLKNETAALKASPPVIQLTSGLDENQKAAQELALQNEQFRRGMYAPNSNTPVRAEIFGVYPWRESDLTSATKDCQTSKSCYRVEMYNYAYNLTVTAVADVKAKKILALNSLRDTQPDIPEHLTKLAIHIATNAPEVQNVLGYKPTPEQALMPNTKTALNKTRCERSQHLCVAPTFVQGEDALWAIVNLTELSLVGVQWTKVGLSSRLPITEKNLQDQAVTSRYCQTKTPLSRNGWQMEYILTGSDGLQISGVSYNGRAILRNAKLVDWHVMYSQQQGFGYSDAVGCPIFSQAAVVAAGGPKVAALGESGFALVQDFWSLGWPAPCNYYYQQRYEFYNDGRFRPVVASVGRGCGNDGLYRPVTRLAFAGDQNSFAEWSGSAWNEWATEKWQLQTDKTAYTPEGYQYRLSDTSGSGFYIEPGRGQFADKGRGDNAYTYVTRYQADKDEGESDLVTLGPCCNMDYKQGPEKYIEPNPEPIKNAGLVVWYVAQLKNDDTLGNEYCWAQSILENGVFGVKKFPCYAGPMFVPIKAGSN